MSKIRFLPRYTIAALLKHGAKTLMSLTGGAPVLTAYWYRRERNFGDLLTPLILKSYGVTPVWAPPGKAQLCFIGSIIEHLPNHSDGTVFGSGFIAADSTVATLSSRVLGVRGHLSASKLSPHCRAVGDPALLIRRIWRKSTSKKYKLGVVPHYVHLPQIATAKNYLKEAFIIDPRRSPLEVIENIASCEYIVSSSLHGLIVADALNIPSKWAVADGLVGGQFKFLDYFSILGHSENPIDLFGDLDQDGVIATCRRKHTELLDSVVEGLDTTLREYLAQTVGVRLREFVLR